MNIRHKFYDLLIVGAGPAGCAAAIQGLREGLNVCLIEYMAFPRFRPGETLSPGVVETIKKLTGINLLENPNAILHNGFDYVTNGNRHYRSYGGSNDDWVGTHVERSVLDSILLKAVTDLKDTTVKQAKALKFIQKGEGVEVLTSQEIITASYLIDTSGANSFVRRQLGITSLNFSKPLPIKYRYRSNARSKPQATFSLDNTGWTWQATVSKEYEVECQLFFSADFVHSLTATENKAENWSHGANGIWRIAEQLAGDCFFLAGDSACVVDPACSHGILRAILSGMSAALAVSKSLRNKADEENIKYAYCDWLTDWFFKDCFKLNDLYTSVSKVNDPIGFLSSVNQYYPNLRAWI